MKNTSVLIVLWMVLIHFLLYMFVIPEPWVRGLLARESSATQQLVGMANSAFAHDRATDYFSKFFVETGIQAESFYVFVPQESAADDSATVDLERSAESTVIPWFESRLRTVWVTVYLLMMRLSVALLWLPFVLLTFTPFLIDAMAARKIKMTSFEITSPHMQGIASRAIPISIVGYLLALMVPLYISPLWVPMLLILTSALSWVVVAHFVKRG